ncbi:MAG: sugar-binding protein [Paludibacter sp.]
MNNRLLFLSLVLFIFVWVANAAQQNETLMVNPTSLQIVIDGLDTDDAWNSILWNPINVTFKGEESGFLSPTDFTGKFKVTYNASKFYFFFDITDDIVMQEVDGNLWLGDKVEIYFGLSGYDSLSVQGASGVHSRQFAISAQTLETIQSEAGSTNYPPASDDIDTDGVEYSFVRTATGYTLEVSIDRVISLESVPDMSTVGFDVIVADNDDHNRYRKSWHTNGVPQEPWVQMSGIGSLTLNGQTNLINEIAQTDCSYSILNNELFVKSDQIRSINILDITGKSEICISNVNHVNLSNLTSGIYIALVKNESGIKKFRFVK